MKSHRRADHHNDDEILSLARVDQLAIECARANQRFSQLCHFYWNASPIRHAPVRTVAAHLITHLLSI